MKAMRLKRLGKGEPFELFDKPDADPGSGEVAIRVHAASVNVVDTKIRAGFADIAPEDPIILGCDVAGVVTATGPGVTRFSVGDEVYGCAGGVKGRDGAYSERMVTDERLLAKKPASLSFRQAAALPLVAITAWEALVDRAQVQPGETVLVHGGTGGVGHIGVQLAKAMGAIVHTTVGTAENAEIAKSLGADRTILYRQQSVAKYVGELTNGRGYDVVFDTVGGLNIAPSIEALATHGRCATTVSVGTSPDLSGLHTKNASLHVIFMLLPMLTGQGLEHHGTIMERVSALADHERISPLLDDARFRLEETGAAHDRLTSGHATGKVVIAVS
ncbi:MAG: zinc-dependent alcohol dehydrogenase family protein [Nitrospirota bacterium]|nr:zinc-dependent alcohol dehydrogenase family protein [Nitrospirota bacterium]